MFLSVPCLLCKHLKDAYNIWNIIRHIVTVKALAAARWITPNRSLKRKDCLQKRVVRVKEIKLGITDHHVSAEEQHLEATMTPRCKEREWSPE